MSLKSNSCLENIKLFDLTFRIRESSFLPSSREKEGSRYFQSGSVKFVAKGMAILKMNLSMNMCYVVRFVGKGISPSIRES